MSAGDIMTSFADDNSVMISVSSDWSGILLSGDYERREFTVPLPAENRFYPILAVIGE
jgi:hypothetical protein